MHRRAIEYLITLDRLRPAPTLGRGLGATAARHVRTIRPVRPSTAIRSTEPRLDEVQAATMFNAQLALEPPIAFEVGGVDLDRLVAHDLLDPTEPQLRLGWPHVAGVPLLALPVTVERIAESIYRLEPVGDVAAFDARLPPEMFAEAERLFSSYLSSPRSAPFSDSVMVPGLSAFVRRLSAESSAVNWAPAVFALPSRAETTERSSLEWLPDTDLDRTAWQAVFTGSEDAGVAEEARGLPILLNADQNAVVASVRSSDVTVVSGPPGTGKTLVAAVAAIDTVMNGGSVLVATSSRAAADSLQAAMEALPAPTFVRFGRPGDRRRVVALLEELSEAGMPIAEAEARLDAARMTEERARERLLVALEEECAFEADLDARDLDPQPMPASLVGLRTLPRWQWQRRRLIRRLLLEESIEPGDELVDAVLESLAREARIVAHLERRPDVVDEATADLKHAHRRLHEAMAIHVTALQRAATRQSRSAVTQLRTALEAGSAVRAERLAEISDTFLSVAPMWIGTLDELESTLPRVPGQFELVIIDEASHVDLARAAPALARARRCLIMGDPKQLRHVSFVSDADMESAAATVGLEPTERALLDVRRMSVYDLAATATPPVFLSEHFRSTPHIIGFSDERFYGDRLTVMTRNPVTDNADRIDVIVTEDEVGHVLRLIEDAAGRGVSMGVVTPFRDHADAIEEAVIARVSHETIRRMSLVVGTVHSVQGAERDEVIISLGLDDRNPGAIRFAEDPNLFNVMVTRARQRVIVLTHTRSLGRGLLADYLRYSETVANRDRPRRAVSTRTAYIARHLEAFGFDVHTGYPVGEHTADIAVGIGSRALALTVGVHPGGPVAHLERRQTLERLGWEVMEVLRSPYLAIDEAAALDLAMRVTRDEATSDQPS